MNLRRTQLAVMAAVLIRDRERWRSRATLIRSVLAPSIFIAAVLCTIAPQWVSNARNGGAASLSANRWWNLEIGFTVPVDPGDLEVAKDNLAKHIADSNHPYDQLVRYRHQDGSTVWVRCRGIAIRDGAGNAIRLLGAHNDVTALKRFEIELIENFKQTIYIYYSNF